MNIRISIAFLNAFVALLLLSACAQPAANPEASAQPQSQIYVVPDTTLPAGEHNPRIYTIDPNAPLIEIPESSVPLAASYVDVSDGVSQREAEAIAIHYAGATNNDVQFLHSRLVEEGDPYYYVAFRIQGVPYVFRIRAEDGEILLYEQGE